MKAVLIIIGDEILSGNTLDTNSNFIAGELKKIGMSVAEVYTVPDEVEAIKEALGKGLEKAEVILATGGLGPTRDDKTKTAFAEFFDDSLTMKPEALEHLTKLLEKRNRAHLLEVNRHQAITLSRASVIQNDHGTAPCQRIEHNGKLIFCLPGVPYEVKPLITEKIIPFIREKYSLPHIETRIISVVNVPESVLAMTISEWETSLPEALELSYLPIGNRVKLRLTGTGKNLANLTRLLDEAIEKLRPLIGANVISWDGNEIQEILKNLLVQKKLTVSAAESCTGGELARLLTSVTGSSQFFPGGIIPYDFHKKIELLGVSASTIQQHTVVSAEVAEEMAEGCRKLFRTDIAVATTGVAGPGTDEFNNEVGLVYYTICTADLVKTNKLYLPHLHRNDFANFVSQRVLQDLVEILVQESAS